MPKCTKCGESAAFHELTNFDIKAPVGPDGKALPDPTERMCFRCLQKEHKEALGVLRELVGAAVSFHDYNCHGSCCATCSELTESVEEALKIVELPWMANNKTQ